MKSTGYVLLGCVAMLCGCASLSPVAVTKEEIKTNDPAAFLAQMVNKNSHVAFKDKNLSVHQSGRFTEYQLWFSAMQSLGRPYNYGRVNYETIKSSVMNYCAAISGGRDSGWSLSSSGEHEHQLTYTCSNGNNDLFFVDIKDRVYPARNDGSNIHLLVSMFFPKQPIALSNITKDIADEYLDQAQEFVVTSTDMSSGMSQRFVFRSWKARDKEMEKRQTEDAQARMEIDRALEEQRQMHIETRLPYVKKIGAKVCREEAGFTAVGFVEQVVGDRIQIRINDTYENRGGAVDIRNMQRNSSIWGNARDWAAPCIN